MTGTAFPPDSPDPVTVTIRAGISSTFAWRPGETISYETRGRGPAAVLLIHGLAADRGTWDDLWPLFPAERYTLYRLDLKGAGASAKPPHGCFGPEEQAAMVLAFLKWVCPDGAVLVGHSFGGTIALLAALAERRIGRARFITRLILIGAPAWPQPLPRFLRLLKQPLLTPLILMLPTRLVVSRALRSVYFDHSLVDARRIARYAPCFRGWATIAALCRTARQLVPTGWEVYCAAYSTLDLPLLLLWGRQDRVVRLRQGERLRDAVPGARLEILEECGHNPHEERPDETWRFIRRFLEE